jgi:hypothetical protein
MEVSVLPPEERGDWTDFVDKVEVEIERLKSGLGAETVEALDVWIDLAHQREALTRGVENARTAINTHRGGDLAVESVPETRLELQQQGVRHQANFVQLGAVKPPEPGNFVHPDAWKGFVMFALIALGVAVAAETWTAWGKHVSFEMGPIEAVKKVLSFNVGWIAGISMCFAGLMLVGSPFSAVQAAQYKKRDAALSQWSGLVAAEEKEVALLAALDSMMARIEAFSAQQIPVIQGYEGWAPDVVQEVNTVAAARAFAADDEDESPDSDEDGVSESKAAFGGIAAFGAPAPAPFGAPLSDGHVPPAVAPLNPPAAQPAPGLVQRQFSALTLALGGLVLIGLTVIVLLAVLLSVR